MQDVTHIGLTIGAVGLASLVLQIGLSPSLNSVLEWLHSRLTIPDIWGGVASLVVGTGFGLTLGLVAWWAAGESPWLLIGAFGGLFLGSSAIQHEERFAAKRSSRLSLDPVNRPPITRSAPASDTRGQPRSVCGSDPAPLTDMVDISEAHG